MFKKFCVIGLLSFLSILAFSQEPLPADEAFAFSYQVTAQNTVLLSWQIADGHYLYKQKVKFIPSNAEAQIVAPVFPVGEIKDDKLFGTVEIYRKALVLELSFPAHNKDVEIVYQGCSDAGLCYLPIHKTVLVASR